MPQRRFVCSIDELPPGGMKLVDVGKFGVGVYHVRGALYAIAPSYAINRFPADQRERIMRGNATALYGLPATVKALPGEQRV